MPENNSETTNMAKAKPRAFTSYTIDNILMRAKLVTTGHSSDPDIQAIMLYRKLARRALKTRPQLLEKLGIKA
ncbi:hypothetical protein [Armatimonas sp.]|uniref:hypothetical protein n=1 Tax=Armatimonas sp. TaxID=1872638 RepID=UPI00286C3E7F|nr:hypothetical protein [Armatimonas sp.]